MEENTQLNSDVQTETSSESQSSAVEQTNQSLESGSQEAQQNQEPANVPFHEHPRFRELVQQKNQFAEQTKALEKRLSEMQAQMESFQKARDSEAKPKNPIIDRLKEIDPEFGQSFEEVYSLKDEMAQFKQWREQMEFERIRAEATSTVSKLHEEYKVPKELQSVYQTQIQAMAAANPNLGVKDLPGLYKAVHDNFTKIINGIKQAERSSYVADKKQDAKIPASATKGVPTPVSKKSELSKDPLLARQQLVKEVLKASKASKDI